MKNGRIGTNRGIPRARAMWAVTALVVAVSGVVTCAAAQGLSDIPAAFVDVGTGARAAGMRGAVVASVSGPNAVFWNPAGLASTPYERGVSLSHSNEMGLVPYSAGAFMFRVSDYTLAAGLLYSGDDVLSETTLLTGAARLLPPPPWSTRNISTGIVLRTRWASFGADGQESVNGSAVGVGLDAGLTVPVTDLAELALVGRDVVNLLKWDSSASGDYSENVPAVVAFGLGLRQRPEVLIEVGLDKSLHADVRDLVRAGAEVTLFDVAVARCGYSVAVPDGDPEEYSLGAGARVAAGTSTAVLDVAYVFGRLTNTLRLSLAIEL